MTVSISAGKNFARAWWRAKVARQCGPAVFAQALLARHGQGLRRVPRITLLLAPRAQPHHFTLHRHIGNTVNQFTVNMQTVFHRRETAPDRLARVDTTRPLLAMTRHASASAPALATAHVPSPPVRDNAFRRMVTRRTRTETEPGAMNQVLRAMSVSPEGDPARNGAPSAGIAGDLPMLRPRSKATVAATIEASPATDVTAVPPRETHTAPAQPLQPHEIERITEQVLGSIDRRIIAERERQGRI